MWACIGDCSLALQLVGMPAALAGAAALTDSQAAKAAPNMVRRRKKRLLVAHKKSSGQIKRKPASHVSTTCSLSVYAPCSRQLGLAHNSPWSRLDTASVSSVRYCRILVTGSMC